MILQLSHLISALAALTWPLLALAFLLLFKSEIQNLLNRLSHLKKGKLLGQEIELDNELDKLEVAAEKAQEEALVAIPPVRAKESSEPVPPTTENRVIEESAKSPKAALLLISAELDQKLRRLLAATGWHQNIPTTPFLTAIDRLVDQGSLPEHVRETFKLFREIRNKIVHGHQASDEDIFRAIDSGLVLLKAIDAIPAETNVVYKSDVDLFHDQNCTQLIADAKGLILETTSPGQTKKAFRIFPTTRTHFEKGKRVAWEWNFEKIWGKAWYKDPISESVKSAWDSAAEFIGRHLDDV